MCVERFTRKIAMVLSFVIAFTMSIPQISMGPVRAAGTNISASFVTEKSTSSVGNFTVDGTGSSWGDTFGYNVQVNNKMSQAVENWKLVIENPEFTITSIWCASANVSGNTLAITPEDWNKGIAAGNGATFGFTATGTIPTMDSYKIIYYMNGMEYTFINGTEPESPVVTTAAPVATTTAPVVTTTVPVVTTTAPVATTTAPVVTTTTPLATHLELNVSNSIAAGTYSSDFTVNGFTFITGGSSWVVDSSNRTCNGNTYTLRAKTGGKGTTTKRAVAFTTNQAGTLVVHAMSGGSTERRLTLNYNGTDIQSQTTVPSVVKELIFTLPAAGSYVLYPADDNIGIFYMKVPSGNGSGNSTLAPTATPVPTATPSTEAVSGDLYVAPNANGNGTLNSPMSFTKALTTVKPGKTIYCLAGTYSYSDQITVAYGNNGAAGQYKTVAAYNGANVVFDFSQQYYGDTATNKRGIQLNGDYWKFYGITITGAADNGMMLSGSHNLIENCVFDGNRDTGLQVSRRDSSVSNISDWPSYNTIKDCTSRNNMDPATGENADGFAAKLTCGEGNVFDGCISYNNVDDGWDCYAKAATGPIGVLTIKNCIAFRNGATSTGVFTANSDGNGFKLGGSGVGTPHIVTNCIAFENKNHGFTDNNNPTALKITNCTSFNNSRDNGAKANFQMNRAGSGAVYKNLLSFSTNTIAGDKFIGTIENSVFYNSSEYYRVYGATVVNNNKVGTVISGPSANDFASINSPALGVDVHKIWRNADGSINTGSFLKVRSNSTFYGMGATL
ncbi:MAG: right-handed parallel beta-helix repeat-containing protein [Clostridium sp.]|nr:right-handed parallel beta-helix repeat-containing protein [Clostridium sp.]